MVGAWSDATPTITSAAVAGMFHMKIETQSNLSARKGEMRDNLRGDTITNFKSKIADGFGITKARALSGVRDLMPVFELLMEDVRFNKSKGTAQTHYAALNESNFEELTRSR